MVPAAILAACATSAAEMPRAGPEPEPRAPVAFEDWSLVCAATCAVRTVIVGRDGSEVLALIARPGDAAAVEVSTPLPLFLPDGVVLTLGGSEPRPIPWRTCDADACEARAPLVPALLSDLRRERTASVEMTLETGERVRLAVSLLGFTAAWAALSDAP